jgi:hypothetical protein
MQATAARCQPSTIPDRLNWRSATLDTEVSCTGAVLDAVRREAVEGLYRLVRGGLEVGGILLGKRVQGTMEILGTLPLECQHQLGPSFVLSAADEGSLEAVLKSHKRGALQPVGLYISHSRRGFSVAETDIKIVDRYFPEPWKILLILMPAKVGPIRAGFFMRESPGGPFSCAHDVLLPHVEHRIEPAPIQAPIATGAPLTPVVVNPDPAPAPARTHRHWQLNRMTLGATIAFLLCVFAAGLWLRVRTVPAAKVPMHVSELGAQLRVEWDPAQEAVRRASAGTLEIRDGERRAIAIPLGRSGLDNGSVLYVPQSDNIEVRLKLRQGSGSPSESVVYFINPSRHATAPAVVLPPETAPATAHAAVPGPVLPAKTPPPTLHAAVPAAILPLKTPATPQQASEPILRTQPRTPSSPPAAKQLVAAKQLPVEKQPGADRKKPGKEKPIVKAFQPPDRPDAAGVQLASPNLPELPDIPAGQSAPSLPLMNSAPLVGILVSQTHLADPPKLRTGRLIWTGTLRKNTQLSFSPQGASLGVLNGRLPGVPVKVSIQPAELVDRGIAVFSKDGERSRANEPPSAWNGWNVVYQDWDPKRIADVEIVEAPGPANNWKRLVLQNGNRNVSVVIVSWQSVAAP